MFGPNNSRVDAMYRRYLEDPNSVAEVWREFFADYEPHSPELVRARRRERQAGSASAHHRRRPSTHQRETTTSGTGAEKSEAGGADVDPSSDGETVTELKGPARIISSRMDDSLAIPVATSVRTLPAKLLEVNRETINSYLRRRQEGRKVSYTHLIGWAVVQAVATTEGINVAYTEVEGRPHKMTRDDINLGLAISLGEDARASLVVPNIKKAQRLDFREFWLTYEDLVTRARNGDLQLSDFEGTTITLTNPGTIGTTQSAPRLMEGQGAIIGVGAVAYPAEHRGSDPARAAEAGLSRVVTLTSTYDHRVIQGATSGELLARIEELLSGEDDFYDRVFAELGIHYTPARWAIDEHPARGAGPGRASKEAGIARLINAYRTQGHLIADTDPLRQKPPLLYPELDIHYYGLTIWDLDREYATGGFGGATAMPLKRVLSRLRQTYCDTTGIEYMHITDTDQKRWIQEYVEVPPAAFSRREKLRVLAKLNQAEAFERFLHTKYLGQKRFGLEGSESLIPALDSVLESGAAQGQTEVVIGMAHRGRLNVLTNIVGKSYAMVFSEFEGQLDPASTGGSGDVKYHLGARGKYETSTRGEIAVELVANPSHLEAVDPVLEGVVRAKQERIGEEGESRVLPLLIHGDAAFSGQGVVVETLHLSQLSGYQTGGTVHIVVNNQVGFTTPVQAARSSIYATDVAKAIEAPIIHVNADDPEAVVRAGRFAVEYRNAFARDVVIDLVCYRRRGHNEGDEPSFTQPLMYKLIDDHTPVRKLYLAHLVDNADISVDEGEAALAEFRDILGQAFDETRESAAASVTPVVAGPEPEVVEVLGAREVAPTRVEFSELEAVLAKITIPPEDFTVHPKLVKLLENRARALDEDAIDWGTAEALALGTLARQGVGSRLAGEDSKRGTFSHRHAVMVCHDTGREWSPLAEIGAETLTTVVIVDSLLSEFAAVGFEYGYSIERFDHLVIWEAQFGDFANGAQVVIDQFVAAGEARWGQPSGLVMLLPHGHDGQGPDHSSGRIERFLQMCAEDNMRVVVPATTGQYFHLLRRQALTRERKPLIVFAPKTPLRTTDSFSRVEIFTDGRFETVLDDPNTPDEPRRVVLCAGKIYHELTRARESSEDAEKNIAIIRVAQLYPIPEERLAEIADRYADIEVVWCQEEPENQGAWRFVEPHLERIFGRAPLYVGRPASPSTATGSARTHQDKQEKLISEALG